MLYTHKKVVKIKKRKFYDVPTIFLSSIEKDETKNIEEYATINRKIVDLFNSFGIKVVLVSYIYGIKITKFIYNVSTDYDYRFLKKYENDIKMVLNLNNDVIIFTGNTDSGKKQIQIDIPNENNYPVCLYELVNSWEFQNSKYNDLICLGKNLTGENNYARLSELSHILTVGSIESGRTLFTHSVLMSLIYKTEPKYLKFALIDLTMVEFKEYYGLPYNFYEPVNTFDDTIKILDNLANEIEERYAKMSEQGCNNYENYLQVINDSDLDMPRILVVINQFEDLLLLDNEKVVKNKISQLLQNGANVGIHFMLSTKSTKVDVLSGSIVNNIPTKILFKIDRVSNKNILKGQLDAEKLLGNGDMLCNLNIESNFKRLQSCYLMQKDIGFVTGYLKSLYNMMLKVKKNKEKFANINSENNLTKNNINIQYITKKDGNKSLEDYDYKKSDEEFIEENKELIKQALLLGKNSENHINFTSCKINLSIGYPKAVRIIQCLENLGYISKPLPVANHNREILLSIEEINKIFD